MGNMGNKGKRGSLDEPSEGLEMAKGRLNSVLVVLNSILQILCYFLGIQLIP
jgi:hypothetical protein